MRITSIGFVAAAAIISATLMPSSSKAEGSRWCADYSGEMGGSSNCGFDTYQQCMLNVTGIGGFCRLNPFFTGSQEQQPVREKKRNG